MRSVSRTVGALSIRAVDPDDHTAEVLCEVEGCDNMALQRVWLAGHQAGEVCTTHAKQWARLWAELTDQKDSKPDMPVSTLKRSKRIAA